MKRVVMAMACVVAFFSLAAVASAAPGDLDPSFDGDGKRTIDIGSIYDRVNGVAVAPDGKIVLAGYHNNAAYDVARLNTDGSLDTSFGGGLVSFLFDGYLYQAYVSTVVVQPDGKVVVWGSPRSDSGADVGIARLNANGALDGGFGSGGSGKRVFGASDSYDISGPLVLRPNGQFLAGYAHGSSSTDRSAYIGQMDSQGFGDPGFGLFGLTSAAFPGVNVEPKAIALMSDGRFVVEFRLSNLYLQPVGIGVARYQPNGALDGSFDGDGVRTLGSGGAAGIAVLPDGKILVGGSVGTSDFVVTRLNPDGSPDTTFGDQGSRTIDFEGTTEAATAMAVQANGKILIAGTTNSGGDFAIARLQPGGELDTTFNFDGKQKVNFGQDDSLGAMTLQQDGKIVLAGRTTLTNDVAVARLEGDPVSAGGGPAGGGPGGVGGSGGKPPRCGGKRATIIGTNRSEKLKGTKKSDVIVALGGNDRISGGRGNDRICAGKGKDKVTGGAGNDYVDGGAGNDTIKGDAGKDKLLGGAGKDRLSGGGGRDNCTGGGGKDRATCERKKSI